MLMRLWELRISRIKYFHVVFHQGGAFGGWFEVFTEQVLEQCRHAIILGTVCDQIGKYALFAGQCIDQKVGDGTVVRINP